MVRWLARLYVRGGTYSLRLIPDAGSAGCFRLKQPRPGPPSGPPKQSAQAWLLDQCPPVYGGHLVLRCHPVVLAWLARRHAEAPWRAMGSALAGARAELADVVEPGVLEAAIGAIEKEQVRLVATGRAITLVLKSLLGHRHILRL